MAGDVFRRCDGNLAHVAAKFHTDHILFQNLTQGESDVEAARNQVDDCVVHQDIELDVRIGGMESGEDRRNIDPEGMPQATDSHDPGRPIPEMPDIGKRRIEFGKSGPDAEQQALPGFCQGDATGRAMDETNSKPLFERANDLAERRWGETELFRGLGEVPLLGNGDEGAKISVSGSPHS